jgi:hypothetical protein
VATDGELHIPPHTEWWIRFRLPDGNSGIWAEAYDQDDARQQLGELRANAADNGGGVTYECHEVIVVYAAERLDW